LSNAEYRGITAFSQYSCNELDNDSFFIMFMILQKYEIFHFALKYEALKNKKGGITT